MTINTKNAIIIFCVLITLALLVTFLNNRPKNNQKSLAFLLTLQYTCKDENTFTVKFLPNEIIEVTNTLSEKEVFEKKEKSGETYINLDKTIYFHNDEIIIENIKTKKSTICNQVNSPNSQITKFGENQEAVKIIKTLEQNVEQLVIGKWQNSEDKNFIREFKESGETSDYFDKKQVTVGNYLYFNKENPIDVNFFIEPNADYIQISDAGLQPQKYTFKILNINSEVLEVWYFEKSKYLKFLKYTETE